jgi:M6 family metalloprotease-like protein
MRPALAWLCCCASLVTFTTPAAPSTGPSTRPADPYATYHTVLTATVAKPLSAAALKSAGQPAYLGIATTVDAKNRITVQSVDPGSPAASAGIQPRDIIIGPAGHPRFFNVEEMHEWLQGRLPGDTVKLQVARMGKEIDFTITLIPTSRPLRLSGTRAVMGVQLRDATEGEGGAIIDQVTPNMPAATAGMKPGDIIVSLNGVAVAARQALNDALANFSPDDEVKLTVKRGDKLEDLKVKLAADQRLPNIQDAMNRLPGYFKRDTYRLALIGVEFPDIKRNPRIRTRDWEDALFSLGSYTKTSATSQPVYGSMNDFYREDSAGAFHVEGKMFDYVEVSKKRAEYGFGTGDNQKMMPEALDKLYAREGKDCLAGYDGIAFIYAGERPQTTRGGLFWPHKGNVSHEGKRWNYLIVQEGGSRMTNISVFTHEFGHMLGLPDLYARPENPGSEGLGTWCLMSNQNPNGRPQHMGAWCKEQLGWLKPAMIDPTVPQKLVLGPVEGSSRECFKVLARADGSEYFLLENRRKTGFDTDLAGEGLLIWRVMNNRPFLEESHGVEGPLGPRSFPQMVPFPSQANHSFTPFTTPSSRAQLGGGMPVFITEIERHNDGKVTFAVGYEYY